MQDLILIYHQGGGDSRSVGGGGVTQLKGKFMLVFYNIYNVNTFPSYTVRKNSYTDERDCKMYLGIL